MITAGLAFVQASNRDDEIFVTRFNDHVRSGLPVDTRFSADVEKLREALDEQFGRGKDGALRRDRVFLETPRSRQTGQENAGTGERGRRQASSTQNKDVIALVRESRATIYTIGIFGESDQDRNPALLRRLASTTGGEVFFSSQTPEVVDICRQIAKDIRNRYIIGYVPIRVNGKAALRSVKVAVVERTKSGRARAQQLSPAG